MTPAEQDSAYQIPHKLDGKLDKLIELQEKQVELLQALVAADIMATEQNGRVLDLLSGSETEGAMDAFLSQRLMGGEGGRRR